MQNSTCIELTHLELNLASVVAQDSAADVNHADHESERSLSRFSDLVAFAKSRVILLRFPVDPHFRVAAPCSNS